MEPKKPRYKIFVFLVLLIVTGGFAWRYAAIWLPVIGIPYKPPAILRARLIRPYGMAPAAFDGFVRACQGAHVHPWRISQTLGNHPRSVGYHLRDGIVKYRGKELDYSAAVDIATSDLKRPQIMKLVEEMGRQGFAAFYREGPRWVNGEHIHAVYAPLKMKPQLQRQVREWEGKRRRAGKPRYKWQKRWRRNWR